MSTPTRERILDAAITLFGERGFKGTSVADIEAAAGLSPGAGGMFHHFKSKQAVLEAGIERHLARLDALHEIRRIVGDVGDVHTQLTIMARYALSELDSETALVRLLVLEARLRPEIASIVERLQGDGLDDFAGWVAAHSDLTAEQARTVAALGLGLLLSSRMTSIALGTPVFQVADDTFVAGWVHTMVLLMQEPPASKR